MKVLFVFSKVLNFTDFFEFFVKGYLDELKKVCDVKSVCFNIEKTEILEDEKKYFDLIMSPPLKLKSFDSEKRILETSEFFRVKLEPLLKIFNPDVIHVTDIFSYLPFRLENNIFYSFCSDLKRISFLDNSSSKITTTTVTGTKPFNPSDSYTYTPDAAADLPTLIPENAGAGVWSVVQ